MRDADGAPVVIRNAPLLDDGTPMPTRYWLVDPDLVLQVSRLEAAGGVRAAEAAVDPDALAADAHAALRRRARRRDPRGPRRAAAVRRGRRHPRRGEVPARALRATSSPVATTRSGAGCAAARGLPEGHARRTVSRRRRDRHRDQLDAPARRRGRRAAPRDATLVTLDRRMRITRLGQGVDATGRARARSDRAHGRGAARVPRPRSTSSASSACATPRPVAARDAANRDEFFDRGRGQSLGAAPELLSGEEEARCRSSVPPPTSTSRAPVPRRRHRRWLDRVRRRHRRAGGPRCRSTSGACGITEQFLHSIRRSPRS